MFIIKIDLLKNFKAIQEVKKRYIFLPPTSSYKKFVWKIKNKNQKCYHVSHEPLRNILPLNKFP